MAKAFVYQFSNVAIDSITISIRVLVVFTGTDVNTPDNTDTEILNIDILWTDVAGQIQLKFLAAVQALASSLGYTPPSANDTLSLISFSKI